jgi:hypothetical protein
MVETFSRNRKIKPEYSTVGAMHLNAPSKPAALFKNK